MPIIPMLAVRQAKKALQFYADVFGAVIVEGPYLDEEGRITHAELKIGDDKIMVADELPDHNKAPDSLGGTPILLLMPVIDLDGALGRALQGGAVLVRPVGHLPTGERLAKIQDPFGHIWMVHGP
jgi:PhnB protein